MIVNGKKIDLNKLDIDNKLDPLKKRENGLFLRDRHIEILNKYDIDYKMHSSLSSLIFEIEEILNYESDLDDLEALSEELSEINYYNYTNK